MYYKATLKLSDKYTNKDTETILSIVTDINKRDEYYYPECFPYLIDSGKLYVTFVCRSCFCSLFIKDLSNFEGAILDIEEVSEISFLEYSSALETAIEKGYVSTINEERVDGITINRIPEVRILMPFKMDYPISLKEEIERIESQKEYESPLSMPIPVHYYIVSNDKDRRAAMRNALLKSLRENDRVLSSYYGYVDITKNWEDYPISIDILKRTKKVVNESALVISIDDDNIFDDIIDMHNFVDAISYGYSDNVFIIESNYYDKDLVEALSNVDAIFSEDEYESIKHENLRLVLIQDPGYTKKEVQELLRKSLNDESGKNYFSYHEFQRLIKKDINDPISELLEKLHLDEAKDLINGIISYSSMLEERKLRGLNSNNSPALREYQRDRKGYMKTLRTDIPSLNMVFYGDDGREKKSVANLYARILQAAGFFNENIGKYSYFTTKESIIKKNPSDSIRNVMKMFHKAQGGFLFIDWNEYSKDEITRDKENAVLSDIVRYMDYYKENLMVILSLSTEGYREVLVRNPGLFSSVPYILPFPSYND